MKKLCLILAAAIALLTLGACGGATADNRRAAGYADTLERGEALSAADYGEIVGFYCDAVDRALAEVASKSDADDEELRRRAEKARAERPDLSRLGSALFAAMPLMPDTTRHTLLSRLGAISERYADSDSVSAARQ